jgi:DmsE family decaheme c-type cytochrome
MSRVSSLYALFPRFLLVGSVLCTSALAAAPQDEVNPDRSLAGDAVCTRCHDQAEAKPVLSIYQTAHGVKADSRTPGCQSCHGASTDHVKNEAAADPRPPVDVSFNKRHGSGSDKEVATCLACHENGQRQHWEGSKHESAKVGCANCHASHVRKDPVLVKTQQPEVCFACHKSERAQIHRVSTHPVASGSMSCSDCHNPHGSTGPSLMRKGTINQTCTSCHAEKRGPFLWEHEPVSESCVSCHTPHGSNNAALLKTRTPFLCQNCHSGDHAAQVNSAANLRSGRVTTGNGAFAAANAAPRAQLVGKNCQACHFQTHGTNDPAGGKLMR